MGEEEERDGEKGDLDVSHGGGPMGVVEMQGVRPGLSRRSQKAWLADDCA